MSTDNGGSAFPYEHKVWDSNYCQWKTQYVTDGMTLLDYFAAHSVQPGCGEIASLAGLAYRMGRVWRDDSTSLGSFDDWFNGLPLAERLDLFARVKYAMAAAMLRAREQQ
jgi:hypothetical protein